MDAADIADLSDAELRARLRQRNIDETQVRLMVENRDRYRTEREIAAVLG